MRNLDFEILKSNYWNLKIFSGLRNESGPKWVGAQMGQGPNELGPKCVGAQMSRGPNESGPKWVGAQMCLGPNESGPKCAGAQMSWGPNVLGPKWVRGPNEDWAQMCPSLWVMPRPGTLFHYKAFSWSKESNEGQGGKRSKRKETISSGAFALVEFTVKPSLDCLSLRLLTLL